MYFPNGQSYNVILVLGNQKTLVHEPWPVIPREGEWVEKDDKYLRVNTVMYSYKTSCMGRRRPKPQVQLFCEEFDVLPAGECIATGY